MTKHIHAELIALFAQDAMETDKPWERWEFFSDNTAKWADFYGGSPTWNMDTKYRRKKRQVLLEETDEFRCVREDEYYMNANGLLALWNLPDTSIAKYKVWKII